MYFNKKLTIALGIITVFVFGVFFVPTGPVNAQIAKPKIAFVFSTGGLGDKSFNDAGFDGLALANSTYNLDITAADYAEPKDVPEISDLVAAFADDGSYDLILTIGFSSADAVNVSALAHPTQKFVIIDMVLGLPNVASVVFAEQEGSFLAGVMAAMTTTSNKVAFLGGEEISLIKKFEAGFQQGVNTINSEIEVFSQYAPDQTNPWNDIPGGKSVGLDFIEKGADVIYAAAGETGIGMFNAVNETNTAAGITGTDTKATKPDKIYAIGVDKDQDWTNPGYILTSMVKRVDVAVFEQIKAIVDGTWAGTGADFSNIVTLDLKSGGISLSDMTFTSYEKNVNYSFVDKQDQMWPIAFSELNYTYRIDIVNVYRDAIIDGRFIPGTEPVEVEVASSPGFEGFFAFLGLATISIVLIARRKFKN